MMKIYNLALNNILMMNKGYTRDNIQWVHKFVNLAKRNLSQDQFIDLCKEVVNWTDNSTFDK